MSHYDFVDPEQEAREDELGAVWGDPRRCPSHPHVVIGSPCGVYDGVCEECEGYEPEPEEPTAEDVAAWIAFEAEIAEQAAKRAAEQDKDELDGIPF